MLKLQKPTGGELFYKGAKEIARNNETLEKRSQSPEEL